MFTKPIEPPDVINQDAVVEWSFEAITLTQFEETKKRVSEDTEKRKEYLDTAFTHVIMDMQIDIQELQGKVLIGDMKAQEKILKRQERINELIARKEVG
jgi:predicted DNA-binding ArsR family transcriptional regulator